MSVNPSDDIDLKEVFLQIVNFIRTNFRILFLSSIAGAVIIGGLSFLLPKVYISKMILSSDILTESYSDRITESLDNLIKEQNYKALAVRLGVKEAGAEKIKKIEIESVKEDSKNDKQVEASIFIITVEITDKEILHNLQEGIINYLRNNEFVKIRVRQREFFYKSMIEKIGIEIKSLDSLKKRLFQGQPIYSKSAEMLLIDPTSIYSKIVEFNQQQISYKNNLELVNSIQLVEGFTVFEKPAKPHKLILAIGGFFAGLFVSLLIIAIRWASKR